MRAYTVTDELLNTMRGEGDYLADNAVASIFAQGELDHVNAVFKDFDQNFERPPEDLPAPLRHYLEESSILPTWADSARYERGNDLLGRYAPQLVMGLICWTLPACYACVDGARVLTMSQRLKDYGYRRLMETTQFLLDILGEGGLAPNGYGLRTIQKVRLLHATIRHHLRHDPRWQPSWGVPINQEDLVMTMLANSILGLQSLERLGIDLDDEQRESFTHVWNVAGRLLGIDERLIPDSYQDGVVLLSKIFARHHGPSESGVMLTKTLLEVLAQLIPGKMLDGMPASLMRHFAGDQVADMLGVPPRNWTRLLIPPIRAISYVNDELGDRSPRVAALSGALGRNILNRMFQAMRGPNRYDWRIPKSVNERWSLDASA